ncbi:hypothetical protein L9F63_027333, partial [Diploptera punctata]
VIVKRDFVSLLREHTDIDRHSRWSDVKKRVDTDARYKAVESSSAREDWFQIKDENMNNSEDEREKEIRDKERQARMEASLREREKEVQRTLATHLRDRDKEREQHKHDEAVQHFNALLADLVRNAELHGEKPSDS